MSTSTLLSGSVEFVGGVDLRTVKNVVHELANYTEIEPSVILTDEKYTQNYYKYSDRNLIVCHKDKGVKRYTVHYSDTNFSSHIYDEEWGAIQNVIVSHAKIIKMVDLSLWYLSESDKGIYHDHEALMEMEVKSMEDRLTGDDTDG